MSGESIHVPNVPIAIPRAELYRSQEKEVKQINNPTLVKHVTEIYVSRMFALPQIHHKDR